MQGNKQLSGADKIHCGTLGATNGTQPEERKKVKLMRAEEMITDVIKTETNGELSDIEIERISKKLVQELSLERINYIGKSCMQSEGFKMP